MIKILLGLFLGIHLLILLMALKEGLNAAEIIQFYRIIYHRFFGRSRIVLKQGWRHPISCVSFFFGKLVNLFVSTCLFLVDSFVLMVLTGCYTLFVLAKKFLPVHSISGILIISGVFLGTIFLFMVLYSLIFVPLSYHISYPLHWIKQMAVNLRDSAYETLVGMVITKKESPTAFAKRKKAERIAEYQKISDAAERDHAAAKEQNTRQKSQLDIFYRDELLLFGFYLKDFTLQDLKSRKRALLKEYHPDNCTDPTQMKRCEETCNQIILAYNKLEEAMKKEA